MTARPPENGSTPFPPALPEDCLGQAPAVACSGGPDSVALLHVAADACALRGLPLRVFHVNHGLRRECGDEESLVGLHAARRGAAFHCERLRLPAESGREAALREARYAAFARMAEQTGCDRLLLAHHLDDQIETVAMRALRRAGVRGLRGMPASRPLSGTCEIRRPLLPYPRSVLEAFVRSRGLDFRSDPTNRDAAFLRNRIRHVLLPALGCGRIPFERRLLDLAAEASRLEEDLRAFLSACPLGELASSRWIAIPRPALLRLQPRLRIEALRLLLREHPAFAAGPAPSRQTLEALAAALPARSSVRDLDSGLRLLADPAYIGLRFDRRECDAAGPDPAVEIQAVEGRERIEAARLALAGAPWETLLDAAEVGGPVAAASGPRPGDGYRPLGQTAVRSARKLLQHGGIPRAGREHWLQVRDRAGLLWVPPNPPAARAAAGPGTREALRLRVVWPAQLPGGAWRPPAGLAAGRPQP